MKYFLFVFLFLCVPCFARISDHALNNIYQAEECRKTNLKKAIALCTYWIETESTTNIDRIYYLATRSSYHQLNKDNDGYHVDMEILKYLAHTYYECHKELMEFFDIDFTSKQIQDAYSCILSDYKHT